MGGFQAPMAFFICLVAGRRIENKKAMDDQSVAFFVSGGY